MEFVQYVKSQINIKKETYIRNIIIIFKIIYEKQHIDFENYLKPKVTKNWLKRDVYDNLIIIIKLSKVHISIISSICKYHKYK